MKEKEIKKYINRLGIKKTRELNVIINGKKRKLKEQLINALPDNFKKQSAYRSLAYDLVENGFIEIAVFTNIGLNIDGIKTEEYYNKARDIIQPIVDKWSKLGIILLRIRNSTKDNGTIYAQLEVR